MLQDIIMDVYNILYGMVVTIPTDNVLSQLYVVLDNVWKIILSLMNGGGSILPF